MTELNKPDWLTFDDLDTLERLLEKSGEQEHYDCQRSIILLLLQTLEIELYEVNASKALDEECMKLPLRILSTLKEFVNNKELGEMSTLISY